MPADKREWIHPTDPLLAVNCLNYYMVQLFYHLMQLIFYMNFQLF